MAKYCTNCGHKIDENADVCIKCGKLIEKNNTNIKKNSKMAPWGVWVIIIVSILYLGLMFLAFAAILDEEYDEYNDYNDDYYIDEKINDYKPSVGTVNDKLYYNDLEFRLTRYTKRDYIEINNDKKEVEEGYEYLVFNLSVYNNSEFSYNLITNNFKGYADGAKVEIIENNTNSFNKTISSYNSLYGNIIFKVKKGWSNFELTYSETNSFDKITYRISNNTNSRNNNRKAEF